METILRNMKATITSIVLKGPFKFFVLSSMAWGIVKLLKSTNCKDFKKKGFWTTRYTMTLWESEDKMKNFASIGPHKVAMRNSARIAKEIRTIRIDANELPSWPVAIGFLEKAKIIHFN